MLKIPQARLQQYVNHELPDVQAGFRKGRGTRDQIANIRWIIGKKEEKNPEKRLPLLYWQCQSVCAEHHKLWKILKEMGIPDHITCLLRNLFAGQEATVRTGHRTTDWIQIREGVWQGCILSPCLFKLFRVHHVKFQGWMKHKLESILPGEISIASDTQMTPLLWQKSKKN